MLTQKELAEYLEGWAFEARHLNKILREEGPAVQRYFTEAGIQLALMPGASFSNPFRPWGAGLADADLAAFGFDA